MCHFPLNTNNVQAYIVTEPILDHLSPLLHTIPLSADSLNPHLLQILLSSHTMTMDTPASPLSIESTTTHEVNLRILTQPTMRTSPLDQPANLTPPPPELSETPPPPELSTLVPPPSTSALSISPTPPLVQVSTLSNVSANSSPAYAGYEHDDAEDGVRATDMEDTSVFHEESKIISLSTTFLSSQSQQVSEPQELSLPSKHSIQVTQQSLENTNQRVDEYDEENIIWE